MTFCAVVGILVVGAEASDASDETPPGTLPSLGKRLAPSKEVSVSPTDETSADREVFSGLPPSNEETPKS